MRRSEISVTHLASALAITAATAAAFYFLAQVPLIGSLVAAASIATVTLIALLDSDQ
jgi:hypothetical protein